MTPEQVADRFGISTMTVRRQIKLAKVNPCIMNKFRVGQVTFGQMQALAIADEHGERCQSSTRVARRDALRALAVGPCAPRPDRSFGCIPPTGPA